MQRAKSLLLGSRDLACEPAIVAVLAGDIAACEALAEQAQRDGADLLELRGDLCEGDGQAANASKLADILAQVRGVTSLPVLLTVRHASEGGRFSGTETERLELLLRLLPVVDAVDLELFSDGTMQQRLVAEARNFRKPVVLSFHDFSETPVTRAAEDSRSLEGVVSRALAAGADVVKIAAHAHAVEDVERLTRFTAHCAEQGIVLATMSMGEAGRVSRVFNPFFGSRLTYGFVGTTATTPGQWPVRDLRAVLDLFPGYFLREDDLSTAFQMIGVNESTTPESFGGMRDAVVSLVARAKERAIRS